MSQQLKELYEEKATLAKEMRRLADLAQDAEHNWSAEDEANWTECNSDYNDVVRKIEVIERAEAVSRDLSQRKSTPEGDVIERQASRESEQRTRRIRTPTEEHRALSLQGWCLAQAGKEITPEQRDAMQVCGVRPNASTYPVELRSDYRQVRKEYRALSTTDTAGGDTIPAGFVANFEKALLQFGGVRKVADVMRTASGNAIDWPTVNDTSNTGALLAENTQDAEQDIVTATLTLNAYKYTSKIIRVSAELLQDSAFNLASELGRILGERIGRITNAHFTTGTGSGQPNGIVTAATLGKTAAAVAAITTNELLDLLHSVDPAYREGASWMMHDNVILAIRKLKDTDGQYMWQPGLQLGLPDMIVGYPVVVNQQMASTQEASAKVVLYGQLSKYKIRDVKEVTLKRLVERYADYHQEAFVAFSRHDGDLLDAGTHPVKYLIQAAS